MWFADSFADTVGQTVAYTLLDDGLLARGTTSALTESQANLLGALGALTGIAEGPDGNVWGMATGGVARISATGTDPSDLGFTGIVAYPFPPNSTIIGQSITAGSDGNMWFTEYAGGGVGQVITSVGNNPSGQSVGTINFVSLGVGSLGGITTGPDGNLWFTDTHNNTIDRLPIDCPN